MKVAIFGAYGFLGKKLTSAYLKNTDSDVLAVSRSSREAFWDDTHGRRVSAMTGDVRDYAFVKSVLRQVDVAYYFVHFMGHNDVDMYEQEKLAAQTFGRAASDAKLKRLVYMGGLGRPNASYSEHLKSRHRTGQELRKAAPMVIELQASMIVGRGSVAFDIIEALAAKLPVVLLPKSTETKTQPIAITDAVRYLLEAAMLPCSEHVVVQIGGADIVTYKDLYRRYLSFKNSKQKVYTSPLVTVKLEAKFLNVLIPKVHARIGKEVMESLTTEMIATDTSAARLFPKIKPVGLIEAFRLAR